MKLGTKILIASFILFELAFLVGSVALMEFSFQQSLTREIDAALSRQTSMQASLTVTS